MLSSIKPIHIVIPVKNFLLKFLTNSISFVTYLYGSLFSFMIVFNAKQANIFQLNRMISLLLSQSTKMQTTFNIKSQRTLKDPFLLSDKETRIFLSSLMPLVILLSLTLLFILPLNLLFKRCLQSSWCMSSRTFKHLFKLESHTLF